MRITIIAAADAAWGIGRGGDLPWRLREDLSRFRNRTMGHALVMGRRTVASLPGPLLGRTVLEVSSRGGFASVAAAVAEARRLGFSECLAAGGAAVYLEAAGVADTAEITRVPGTHGCDVTMPDLGSLGWTLSSTEPLGTDGLIVEHWSPPGR